jgi:hypothetical protein
VHQISTDIGVGSRVIDLSGDNTKLDISHIELMQTLESTYNNLDTNAISIAYGSSNTVYDGGFGLSTENQASITNT